MHLRSSATVYQPLLTTTNTPPTMTGMALDNIQRTQTPWTTSLDSKKGSQKSELLDGFSYVKPSLKKMTPNKMTPPVYPQPPSNFSLAYSAPVMTNNQVITRLNNLRLKAKLGERVEFYQLQRTFVSVPHPTETQCTSLVSKPTLYQTLWDITSTTIGKRLEAYLDSPLADLTSTLCVEIDPLSPYPHPHFKHDTEQHKHACQVAIACLSLSSFLDAYKAQVQRSQFDQMVQGNRLSVMSQLSKTLDYCNDTSTYVLSSLFPM